VGNSIEEYNMFSVVSFGCVILDIMFIYNLAVRKMNCNLLIQTPFISRGLPADNSYYKYNYMEQIVASIEEIFT